MKDGASSCRRYEEKSLAFRAAHTEDVVDGKEGELNDKELVSEAMRILALRKHAKQSPEDRAEEARRMVAGRQKARKMARRLERKAKS